MRISRLPNGYGKLGSREKAFDGNRSEFCYKKSNMGVNCIPRSVYSNADRLAQNCHGLVDCRNASGQHQNEGFCSICWYFHSQECSFRCDQY